MQAITIKQKNNSFFGNFDKVSIFSRTHTDHYEFSILGLVQFLELGDECDVSLDGGINFEKLKVCSIASDLIMSCCKIEFFSQTKPFHGFIINDL